MVIIIICLSSGKKYLSLRLVINMFVNFRTQFYLGSISNGFGATGFKETSLKGIADDLSVNYNNIDKSDLLNIYKYRLIKQVFIGLLSSSASLATKCMSLNNKRCIT